MAFSLTSLSENSAARLAGFLYLFILASQILSGALVDDHIYVSGNVAATVGNIAHHPTLFRLGIISEVLMLATIPMLALALYSLLKPHGPSLAKLSLMWRLVDTTIFTTLTLTSFIILQLTSGADWMAGFSQGQINGLVELFLKAHVTGYNVGLIFFALGSTGFGYLFLKSPHLPRLLAGWGLLSCLIVLICTIAVIVIPERAGMLVPGYYMPITLFELLAGLWLLIKGAKLPVAA